MLVKSLMSGDVVSVDPQSSVETAAKLLSRHNVGMLPVCGPDQHLMGVVTDRDLVLRCVAPGEDPKNTPVRSVMSRGCVTVTPGAQCVHASALMARHQIRRLPVVEDGMLIGMLTLGDLAKSQRYDMEAAEALCDISENIVRAKTDR